MLVIPAPTDMYMTLTGLVHTVRMNVSQKISRKEYLCDVTHKFWLLQY